MRKIFLDEFLKNKNRGEEFYDRVLLEFGDDSVAELGEAQIAIEGLSNIAVKKLKIEEQGYHIQKNHQDMLHGIKRKWEIQIYRDQEIMKSKFADMYEETCNFLI